MIGIFGGYEIVTEFALLTSGQSLTVEAPTGKKVVGGGAMFGAGNLGKSHPAADGSSWTVSVNSPGGGPSGVTAYAVCAT